MLSWNGDIHEFLSVYQKNMTDFQDKINSHLSWLNDDLYLDNDFRLALIIQKLDASFSRLLYNQIFENTRLINIILKKLTSLLNESDYQEYDDLGNLITVSYEAYLNNKLELDKDNFNQYYQQLQVILDKLAKFKQDNVSEQYLKGGEN
ncbi:hypothetical protein HZI56_01875 [Lactobacillus salivarius]|uniref:hypothetical protein n=1 Tax=Ligilactobacillus salivarius TaxID=1624 RepID=UPI0015C66E81|nr:hypothetical protein [Ligilactobacillus salivarius]MDO5004226.1 hypothetical protein [Ligilactobacillus salivarius]NXZ96359.1 hypothetical protein [Ligilactobacillus salivarius]NYA58738.1 hypothetical protein [Ligilactobacillus salivarius]NYA61204.1 hypothetical protein [Ligilactobacillus salivarius]NYA63917.1 hypothetical protein [Ligilactobacillus salivarius]